MELAEPSIAAAFGRCAEQGAELVIVMPYFLGPGRHSRQDIPRLAAEAVQAFPNLKHLVTEPLGLHELILRVIDERIGEAIGASAKR
jgi:sirohydrochlorin cobaltochelatase